MISIEDRDKILLKKQLSGKREQRLVEEAAGSTKADSFAPTWDALSSALHITRRGLQKVRDRFPGQTPPPRADGRHDIAAWQGFFTDHGIKASEEDGGTIDGLSMTEWKKREVVEKVRKLQIENNLAERSSVTIDEIQRLLPPMLMAFNTALNNLGPRLCQKLEGYDDFNERLAIIDAEIEHVKKTLASCPWLDETTATDAALPTPPETTPRRRSRASKARALSRSCVRKSKRP